MNGAGSLLVDQPRTRFNVGEYQSECLGWLGALADGWWLSLASFPYIECWELCAQCFWIFQLTPSCKISCGGPPLRHNSSSVLGAQSEAGPEDKQVHGKMPVNHAEITPLSTVFSPSFYRDHFISFQHFNGREWHWNMTDSPCLVQDTLNTAVTYQSDISAVTYQRPCTYPVLEVALILCRISPTSIPLNLAGPNPSTAHLMGLVKGLSGLAVLTKSIIALNPAVKPWYTFTTTPIGLLAIPMLGSLGRPTNRCKNGAHPTPPPTFVGA